MAALTATQITAAGLGLPVPEQPFHMEAWRVPAGAAADTALITPARGRYVVAAFSGHQHNLGAAGTNTNVTITLIAVVGGSGFDVHLLVQD